MGDGGGGAHSNGKRRQTQAHIAWQRDERSRLAGGGCGLCPGGQIFAPVEKVGSGYKPREV